MENRTLNSRKAFTLIELLVVIAIIAILAAILFPVFAQAKQAAKKSTDLSNTKQQSLSAIMYSGDYDDMIVRHRTPNTGDPQGDRYWTRAVQPYMKNWELFRSPVDKSNPYGVWTPGSPYYWDANWQNWGLGYGMNIQYLNPATDYTATQWQVNGHGLPIAYTTVANPADTVFSTDKKNVGSDAGGWYTGAAITAPVLNDVGVAVSWSNGGWGVGSYGDTINFAAPRNTGTGEVAVHWNNGTNVSWVDGHCKYMTPGNLAVGTNWNKTIANTAITVVDRTKYLWDAQ